MKKLLETKKQKIWATISLVWLVLMYAGNMAGYSKDPETFFIFGLMPIILGWGIYYIWYDNINTRKKKPILKKDKNKKESKWVEFASLIGGIMFYKAFGLLGIAGVAIGYGTYAYFNKSFNKTTSVVSGVVAGAVGYFIVALIYYEFFK